MMLSNENRMPLFSMYYLSFRVRLNFDLKEDLLREIKDFISSSDKCSGLMEFAKDQASIAVEKCSLELKQGTDLSRLRNL